MPSPVQELHIQAELANLATVAEFVSACCQSSQVDEGDSYKIQLAVDEAVTNIVEHAYQGEGGEIVLRCWVAEHHFYVLIQDRGREFELEDVPQPTLTGSLAKRKTGGLGLYFMHQLMDEVHFESKHGVNTLQMVKYNVVP